MVVGERRPAKMIARVRCWRVGLQADRRVAWVVAASSAMTSSAVLGPREVFVRVQQRWLDNDPGLEADLLADNAVIELPFAAPGRPSRFAGREEFLAFARPARSTGRQSWPSWVVAWVTP
jgi:hypothetical protein